MFFLAKHNEHTRKNLQEHINAIIATQYVP